VNGGNWRFSDLNDRDSERLECAACQTWWDGIRARSGPNVRFREYQTFVVETGDVQL